jgi:excisionase family DNA binding protein
MKDFLSVKDVAEELQLSERVIRDMFKSGELPGRKIAGKYRTTRDLLKKYIEEGNEQ